MNFINEFFKQFSDNKIDFVLKKDDEYFYAEKELLELSKKIPDCYPGLSLGKEINGVFSPSLFLLELLAEISKNKVFVSKKAEWNFLCGKDLLPENIVIDESKSNIFLVQNKDDKNLGYAKFEEKNGQKIIKNILDRGDYLRRELN
ncbi:hypothetical protein K9L67_01385 [Candidatus Woesearchaeota archaeon]|nr:hypothetical protein [Candidatus Woesearchaeota archaeon]MCF7900857.1 hypothetical protein [Candidatus Woesearchaeota archaeon]MCF8014027.1 hypothetical protein [Candidatus Woesearchaeota archaeon]